MVLNAKMVEVPRVLMARLTSVGFPQNRLGTVIDGDRHYIDRTALSQAHEKLTPELLARLNSALRWGLIYTPSPDVCKGVFPATAPMLVTDPDTFTTAPERLTLA